MQWPGFSGKLRLAVESGMDAIRIHPSASDSVMHVIAYFKLFTEPTQHT